MKTQKFLRGSPDFLHLQFQINSSPHSFEKYWIQLLWKYLHRLGLLVQFSYMFLLSKTGNSATLLNFMEKQLTFNVVILALSHHPQKSSSVWYNLIRIESSPTSSPLLTWSQENAVPSWLGHLYHQKDHQQFLFENMRTHWNAFWHWIFFV